MGLDKKERVQYYKITEGKIRQKTTEKDPEAEERYSDITNRYIYERVYNSCTGFIRKINLQTHEEFGNSISVVLYDPKMQESYSLTITETSRYYSSFVQILPNVDFSKTVTIKPYAFKMDNRQSIGVTILQDGKKLLNYYKDWDEKKETYIQKNGLEKFNFDKVKGDKDELKILMLRVLKFLKAEFKKQLIRLEEFIELHPLSEITQEYLADIEGHGSENGADQQDNSDSGMYSNGKSTQKRGNKGKVTESKQQPRKKRSVEDYEDDLLF